jgi:hypothetical protein
MPNSQPWPALAADPDAVQVADGVQLPYPIAQGTGRPTRHLAELLAELLDPPPGPPASRT